MSHRANIIAGPFHDPRAAFIEAHAVRIEGSDMYTWRSNAAVRRHRRGWYVYLRAQATVHAGSKAWRSLIRGRNDR